MLVRSALVDLRPFRTGLVIGLVGLMVALGEDHGGALGAALGGGLAQVVGEAGAVIVGVALVLAGVLLVTGASAGALLRRSGHAVRQAGTVAAGRSRASSGRTGRLGLARRRPGARAEAGKSSPPVDGVEAFPDVVADGPFSAEPPPLLPPEPAEEAPTGEQASSCSTRRRAPRTASPTAPC